MRRAACAKVGLARLFILYFLKNTCFFYEKRVFWSIQALGVAESDSAEKNGTNSLDESSVALNGVEILPF